MEIVVLAILFVKNFILGVTLAGTPDAIVATDAIVAIITICAVLTVLEVV